MARLDVTNLFSKKTRKQHADDSHTITIQIGSQFIKGYMTNEFQYDVNAQWETLLTPNGAFETIENLAIIGGDPLFQSGIFTRKFYKGGAHVIFNTEFRIVDWEGNTLRDRDWETKDHHQ